MAQETIKTITTKDGVTRPVEDETAREQLALKYVKPSGGIPKSDLAQAVQDALDAAGVDLSDVFASVSYDSVRKRINFYGKGDSTTVIAYLDATPFVVDGMVNNVTLANGVLTITFNTDAGKQPINLTLGDVFNVDNYYTKSEVDDMFEDVPAMGDFSRVATSGSYNDLSDKPTIPDVSGLATKTEVNAKANSADVYTKSQVDGKIPTAVSDLDNDEGFIKASEVSGIVAASGDMAIVETSDYIDIFIYSAEIGITPSAVLLHASGKSQTIKVSGSHLKADININVPNGFTATPSTIQHVGGVVAETDVVIAYTGADASAASGSITATSGDVTKSIPVAYTQYAGPTIIADDAAIAFNAGAGTTQQKALVVQGVNLTDGITAAISGTNAGKFSVNPASISQYDGTASGTLTITYSPAAGDTGTHTATLTLSSSGATSKVITLNGAVSSLTVSKQTMTFNTDQGVAVTDTFTVEGANLNEGIAIAASGTGFSVSPQTIAHNNGMVASTTVTVTYSPSAAGMNTGTITIQSSGVTKTITLSGTAEEIPEATSANEYKFQKGGIYYKVQSVDGVLTDTVGVYNSTYNASSPTYNNPYSGDIVIPSTVKAIVDGVTKTLDVVKVATYAFAYCNGLVSLVIPDSVTTLGNAFLQSRSINFKSLIIGNGATSLPNYTSMTGDGVTYIELGENISSFGTNVDIGIGSTSTMVLKHNGILTLNFNSIKNLNGGNPSDATLKVPSSLVDTYKSAKSWGVDNDYGWHAFNPENITAIDE